MSPSPISNLRERFDSERLGREMHALMRELYPICRSITGEGVRQSLRRLKERIPLQLVEVPTGTRVLDWEVPREWNIHDAWIEAPDGSRVVDFADHNLHLVGYSAPVRRRMPLEELEKHLHSLPDRPDWIPYRTSYYQETWGFCLAHNRRRRLVDGEYQVVVDSDLTHGSLTYGELVLPGASEEEVLVSSHCCHPSMCNDNLSGMMVATFLAELLYACSERRFTYRFLFVPGTIGSITWLATHEEVTWRIRAGLVAANLGDDGAFHYKRSRRGDAQIDRAVEHVLSTGGDPYAIEDFVPFGYDERQYCSPGFDLPVGSLTRTPWGRYPEYHTSADDPEFVRPENLAASLLRYLEVVEVLELDRTYLNLSPKGEPQLGRRGLYGSLGGDERGRERELALLWVLNLSDGKHSLLQIARRSGLPMPSLAVAAEALIDARLLREV